jgi:hypothetical protein
MDGFGLHSIRLLRHCAERKKKDKEVTAKVFHVEGWVDNKIIDDFDLDFLS